MLAKIGSLLLLAAASGCTASNFASTEKTQRRVANVQGADEIAEQKPLTKTPYSAGEKETTPESETPLVEEMIPEVAVVPVPIGGAPLTCIRNTELKTEVHCTMDLPASVRSNNRPAVVFVVSGAIPKQTIVDFKMLSNNTLSFELPGALRALNAFGVGVGVSSGGFRRGPWKYGTELFMTMVGYGKTDLTNVVKDPSFEEIAVPAGGFSKLVQQGDFKSWLARNKSDTGCIDLSPILELQVNHGDQRALDGKQWTELDSACAVDKGENMGNIGLFQDIATIKDHVYAISFGTKRRAEANTLQRMRMSWGGALLFEQDTIQDDWTVFSMIQTSNAASVRIDFEESGYSDGYGTLLDDIRIYDLGLPVL